MCVWHQVGRVSLRALFDRIDRDGSGAIDRLEFGDALDSLGYQKDHFGSVSVFIFFCVRFDILKTSLSYFISFTYSPAVFSCKRRISILFLSLLVVVIVLNFFLHSLFLNP